jgi:hypothetical protein
MWPQACVSKGPAVSADNLRVVSLESSLFELAVAASECNV